MQRIDTATAVASEFGAGKSGFTGGDPTTTPPTPPTNLDAAWFNAVQEELANSVEGFGVALDPTKRNQLFNALIALACQDANWTSAEAAFLTGGDYYVDVAYANGTRIAVSNAGVAVRASDRDNGCWAPVTIPSASQMTSVAGDGNGKWIIGGTGGLWWVSSDDGVTWSTTHGSITQDIQLVIWAGPTNPTKFLVLCSGNAVYAVTSTAFTVTAQPSFGGFSGFVDAALTADGHIAVLYTSSGDQYVRLTTDVGATFSNAGGTWAGGTYSAITYSTPDGALLALTTSGLISKSTDNGATWTQVGGVIAGLPTADIAAHPTQAGYYLCVGQTGLIAAARDGAFLNRRPQGITIYNMNACCFGNGFWTVVGANTILESWRTLPAPLG